MKYLKYFESLKNIENDIYDNIMDNKIHND